LIGSGVASRFLTSRRQGAILACAVLAVSVTSTVLVARPAEINRRRDRTTLDIAMLENALKLYRAKSGHYPDSATGFAALLDVQIIDKEPRDAWGNLYRYQIVEGRPVITSLGADGLPGGEGDNADISNATTQVSSR